MGRAHGTRWRAGSQSSRSAHELCHVAAALRCMSAAMHAKHSRLLTACQIEHPYAGAIPSGNSPVEYPSKTRRCTERRMALVLALVLVGVQTPPTPGCARAVSMCARLTFAGRLCSIRARHGRLPLTESLPPGSIHAHADANHAVGNTVRPRSDAVSEPRAPRRLVVRFREKTQ